MGVCTDSNSSSSGSSTASTIVSRSTDDQSGSPANHSISDVMVRNTFVHVADSCYSEKRAFLEGLLGKPLPPPLEILPHGVSQDELLAFRIDYQMFRAGEAFGAKGEVSNSV